MSNGAKWHGHVQTMALRYGNGWTEADQIEQAGRSILDIASGLDVYDNCKKCWKSMSEWEALGRAVSRRTRGHARHVINVFWLGYFLLHNGNLRAWFADAWKRLLLKRKDMESVVTEDPIEALSNCWFYAGLFHDIANCVEKHSSVGIKAQEVFENFDELLTCKSGDSLTTAELKSRADQLFFDLGPDTSKFLKPSWEKSLSAGHPDHGVVAGVHISRVTEPPQQKCFAREAARAMAIHNLIGRPDGKPAPFLSWENEPIACLLLLCDQIQTWDRERGDKKLSDREEPERAELLEVEVAMIDGHPKVSLSIEYVAPRYLDHAPVVFKRVKDELEEVLEEKPKAALSRITRPWPFSVDVKCWLSGEPLNRRMKF